MPGSAYAEREKIEHSGERRREGERERQRERE